MASCVPPSIEMKLLMRSLYLPFCSRYFAPRRSPSPSSPTFPTKRMSPGVWTFAASIARMTLNIRASASVSSPAPGAIRRLLFRVTVTFVPSGNTVSRCASTAIIGPLPAPLRTPMTLPSASVSTSVSFAARSISRYAAPRFCSLKDGAGICVSVISSFTNRSWSASRNAFASRNDAPETIAWTRWSAL